MKAMILAAGKGKRMQPLTLTTPKPLLEAGGKPLIVHQIERLRAAGIRDLVINHAWLGSKLEAALGDGHGHGVSITWSAETQALETAGGIIQALPHLASAGSPWFLVVNGDIWCDLDFSRLVPPVDPATRALLVLTGNPDHHPGGDFLLMEDGRVHRRGEPRLTFTGISLLHRDLFAGLEPGFRALAPVLAEAMDQGRVRGIHHRGQWSDIGTPQRLAELDRHLARSLA